MAKVLENSNQRAILLSEFPISRNSGAPKLHNSANERPKQSEIMFKETIGESCNRIFLATVLLFSLLTRWGYVFLPKCGVRTKLKGDKDGVCPSVRR